MIKIIGTELYQWDTGREVSVTADGATHVHFANVGDQKAVELDYTDSVKIPDFLLTTGRQLVVYAVKKAENQDGKIVTITIEKRTFGVTHRERPENYVYSEDERNYIYELIRSATEAISGAESIAEEIRTAKENGEFDGKDGYTPQRGTHYWTEEDQKAIRDYINGEIPHPAEKTEGMTQPVGMDNDGALWTSPTKIPVTDVAVDDNSIVDNGVAKISGFSRGGSAKYKITSPGWKRIAVLNRRDIGLVTIGFDLNRLAVGRTFQSIALLFSGYVDMPLVSSERESGNTPHLIQLANYRYGEDEDLAGRSFGFTKARIAYARANSANTITAGQSNPIYCYLELYFDANYIGEAPDDFGTMTVNVTWRNEITTSHGNKYYVLDEETNSSAEYPRTEKDESGKTYPCDTYVVPLVRGVSKFEKVIADDVSYIVTEQFNLHNGAAISGVCTPVAYSGIPMQSVYKYDPMNALYFTCQLRYSPSNINTLTSCGVDMSYAPSGELKTNGTCTGTSTIPFFYTHGSTQAYVDASTPIYVPANTPIYVRDIQVQYIQESAAGSGFDWSAIKDSDCTTMWGFGSSDRSVSLPQRYIFDTGIYIVRACFYLQSGKSYTDKIYFPQLAIGIPEGTEVAKAPRNSNPLILSDVSGMQMDIDFQNRTVEIDGVDKSNELFAKTVLSNYDIFSGGVVQAIGAATQDGLFQMAYKTPQSIKELFDNIEYIHPVAKTDSMTNPVGMDENGALWTSPGGAENIPLIYSVEVTDEAGVAEIKIPFVDRDENGKITKVHKYKDLVVFLRLPNSSDIVKTRMYFRYYTRISYGGTTENDTSFHSLGYVYQHFGNVIDKNNCAQVSWIGADKGTLPLLQQFNSYSYSASENIYPTPLLAVDGNISNYVRGIWMLSGGTQPIPYGTKIYIFGNEIEEG